MKVCTIYQESSMAGWVTRYLTCGLLIFVYCNGLIVNELGTFNIRVGDDVTIVCKVEPATESQISWVAEENGGDTILAINGISLTLRTNIAVEPTYVSEGSAISKLTIKGLREQDYGTYVCSAQTGDSTDRKQAHIQRPVNTETIKVNITPVDMSLSEVIRYTPEYVYLTCRIKSYTGQSMMWFKQPSSKKVSAEMISAGKMVLQSPTKYGVELEVDNNRNLAFYTLSIAIARDADVLPVAYRCIIQTMGAKFADYPYKEITLQHRGTTEEESITVKPTRPSVITTGREHLSSRPTAWSEIGTSTQTTRVIPRIMNPIGVNEVEIGSTVTLECAVGNLGKNWVNWLHVKDWHTVLIAKNTQVVVPNKGIPPKYLSVRMAGNIFRLTIQRVDINDGGIYRCNIVMTDDGGDGPSKDGYIKVTKPNDADKTNGVSRIAVGDSTELHCTVAADKQPKIFWLHKKNGSWYLVSMGHTMMVDREHYGVSETKTTAQQINSSLSLKSVTSQMAGLYRCTTHFTGMPKDEDDGQDHYLDVISEM